MKAAMHMVVLPRASVHDAAIAVACPHGSSPTQAANVHQEGAEDLLMQNGTALNKRIQRWMQVPL